MGGCPLARPGAANDRCAAAQGTPEGVEDNGSLTRVAAFPIGIDPERFARALDRSDVKAHIAQLLNRYAGRKVRPVASPALGGCMVHSVAPIAVSRHGRRAVVDANRQRAHACPTRAGARRVQ